MSQTVPPCSIVVKKSELQFSNYLKMTKIILYTERMVEQVIFATPNDYKMAKIKLCIKGIAEQVSKSVSTD